MLTQEQVRQAFAVRAGGAGESVIFVMQLPADLTGEIKRYTKLNGIGFDEFAAGAVADWITLVTAAEVPEFRPSSRSRIVEWEITRQQFHILEEAAKLYDSSVTRIVFCALWGKIRQIKSSEAGQPDRKKPKPQPAAEMKPAETADWTVLANVPVSSADKEQVRMAAFHARLTFQELVIGAIRRRLVGRPPLVRIERAAPAPANTSIGCNFTQSEKMKIVSAARTLGVTVHEFLQGAIFGEYAPAAEVFQVPAPEPEPPQMRPPGTIRIGAGEKRRIEQAARFRNMSFDQYVAEAAARRMAGRPPMQRVPHSLFPDTLVDVVCQPADSGRIREAAYRAGLSPEEYLAGALFGDYRVRMPKRKLRSGEKETAPAGKGRVRTDAEPEPKEEPATTETKADKAPATAWTEIEDGDRAYFDFAHSNYEKMFRNVVRHDVSLSTFVDEIKSIVPPQYGEFMNVIRQARAGDQKARNRAAEMYLRVAVKTAYRNAKKYGFELDDSISDACLGLMTEIDRVQFRPGKRPFSGAVWRMDSAVIRTNSKSRTGIRFPVYLNNLYCKSYPLLKENGCLSTRSNVDWNAIARVLLEPTVADRVMRDRLLERVKPAQRLESLVPQVKESPEDADNLDYVEFDDSEVPSREDEPADRMAEREKRRFARLLLYRLDKRERTILRLRFGIADGYPYTLEMIGRKLKITRERVRQIENRAMKKLRRFVGEMGIRWEDYL